MESALEFQYARALLEWGMELGATEAIGDCAIDRYGLDAQISKTSPLPQPVSGAAPPPVDERRKAVEIATQAAQHAQTLDQLREAMAGFEHCELKRGARNMVFAEGDPKARLLVLGEAPEREDDFEGRPFAGRTGQLLDRMLAAIGHRRGSSDRASSVYLTTVLPWRPPQNRAALPEEIEMMLPFVKRHVELVNPDVVVLMGNTACHAAFGQQGVSRLRGNWRNAFGCPAMPMMPPASLLRTPEAKRDAWGDLLSIKAKLAGH